MKKVAAALLAVTLVLGTASAQTLPLAAQTTSSRRLECYTGYSEESGLWQAHGVLADAALYYMEQRAAEFAYQGACLFYLHAGVEIGGFDNRVYDGTNQAGKADILCYKRYADA